MVVAILLQLKLMLCFNRVEIFDVFFNCFIEVFKCSLDLPVPLVLKLLFCGLLFAGFIDLARLLAR